MDTFSNLEEKTLLNKLKNIPLMEKVEQKQYDYIYTIEDQSLTIYNTNKNECKNTANIFLEKN